MDGKVHIAARKGDLTISDNTGTTTLAQGQQTTREESASSEEKNKNPEENKKKKRRAAGAIPGAGGGILDSPVAVGIGGAAIGAVTAWVLIQGDEPASPSKP